MPKTKEFRLIITLTMAFINITIITLVVMGNETSEIPPVTSISNSDIEWSGSFAGILPRCKGETKRIIDKKDLSRVPELLEALNVDGKYVAAHVALTFLVQQRWTSDATQWNGLSIISDTSGKLNPPNKSSLELIEKWKRVKVK